MMVGFSINFLILFERLAIYFLLSTKICQIVSVCYVNDLPINFDRLS